MLFFSSAASRPRSRERRHAAGCRPYDIVALVKSLRKFGDYLFGQVRFYPFGYSSTAFIYYTDIYFLSLLSAANRPRSRERRHARLPHLRYRRIGQIAWKIRWLPIRLVQVLIWSTMRKNEKRPQGNIPCGLLYIIRRRPTLPHRCQCSTIGAGGLNFRVRDGNGWIPSATATGNFQNRLMYSLSALICATLHRDSLYFVYISFFSIYSVCQITTVSNFKQG